MANSVPKSIKASLYIDGKPAEASIKNLTQITRNLERELNNLTIGTEAWKRKMEELQRVRGHLQSIRDDVRGVGGAFGQLREELGKVGTIAAGYLGFQFITGQFSNIISGNAKLSDSLADLRRVTGLTEAGVLNLDASLGKLDTRTSKSGLREIAVIAGKLGVAKTEILSFVEATDKLVVALGDELGNADQITTTLGKILNVYDGEVTGDNITRLGNAMVKLANDGVASAGFIADFTQRVSGIAKTAGLSLPATIAIGAGIEELGGRSESAATAMQKLLLSISSDTPKAAKIAGLSLSEFTKILAKAPEEALLKYTHGLVANKAAFSDVTKSLDEAGEEGARTIETITKLGQKTEFFTGKIKDAGKAINGYNEINEAFNLKNQTLGGQLDKLGKDFNSLTTSKGMVNLFTSLVSAASDAIGWIKRNSEALASFIKVLVIAGVAWGTYKAYVFLANSALTSFIVSLVRGETVMALSRASTLGLAAAKALLAGNFAKASQAMRLLNVTLAANPIGAVVAAVVALVTAISLFTDKATVASRIQSELNNVKEEAAKKTVDEKNNIQTLLGVLDSETISREKKLVAVNKLRAIMPEYLKQYSDEEILAGKAVGAIHKYINALEKKSLAEAAQERIKELQKENISLAAADGSEGSGFLGTVNETFQKVYGFVGYDSGVKRLRQGIKSENAKKIGANKSIISEINSLYGPAMFAAAVEDDGPGGSVPVKAKPDKKAESEAERQRKHALSEFAKLGEEYKKLNLDRLNDQLSANQRELKQEADKYDALIQKEKDFLKLKGTTADQRKQTTAKISSLGDDKEAALTAMSLRQETELFKEISELRTRLTDLHETELQKQRNQINKFYDDLVAKNRSNASIVAKINQERNVELGNAEIREKERLEKEKAAIEAEYDSLSGDKPKARLAAINKKYDDELIALKAKFSKELQATKEFQDAVALIEKNRQTETKAEELEISKTKREQILSSAQVVSDAVFTIMSNNRQAESNAALDNIEKNRAKELENKNLTEAQKKRINEKYDAEAKKQKLKAWEDDRKAALGQAVINGALAVVKALPNIGLSIAAGVAAAAQIAVILAEPTPEFAVGGFSNEDPAGYVGQPTIFKNSSSGRPFMAGEAGKEWIAPNWMVTNPRYANVIGMLESARKEKRAFADGGYNADQASGSAPFMQYYSDPRVDKLQGMFEKFITEQSRFNSLPIINDWAVTEDYLRKLENDRAIQGA